MGRHDSPSELARSSGRLGLALLRAVVFLAGALFGLQMAATISYFGGGGLPTPLAYVFLLVPLALALAAPPCWYFAVRGKAGDRWTLAYAGAWTIFLGVIYASVLLNDRFGPF
jgi:hypothetical protein